MAQRAAGKAKGRTAKAEARATRAPARREADPSDRIRVLETQLAKVKDDLAAALARNKTLEENHEQVRNRIDWVIDSLHNLMEK